jgi:uncharacterized damage-inducible protein DinB
MKAENASVVMEFLLPAVEMEFGNTRKVILAVPADKGHYRPDERSMSALELAWHIAASETFFTTWVVTGEFPEFSAMPEHIKTPQDVITWYDGQAAANHAKLKAMTGEQCAKELASPEGALPAITFIQMMNNHTIHHRGQLTSYLRPMGAKVPSIYGTSRDDEEADEAAAKA